MKAKLSDSTVRIAAIVIVILITISTVLVLRLSDKHEKPYIEPITDISAETEDEYRPETDEQAEPIQSAEYTYVLNTDTKKIHLPSCRYVKSSKAENYAVSNKSEEELVSKGYTVCKRCH